MQSSLFFLDLALTCQAAAYAAGDLIGGKLTITVPKPYGDRAAIGYIVGCTMIDQAAQNVAAQLGIFDADPTGTTFTENAALDVADADTAKLIGVIDFPATIGQMAFADNHIRQGGWLTATNTMEQLRMPFKTATGILYGALLTRGAPTFAATNDLTLRFAFEVRP